VTAFDTDNFSIKAYQVYLPSEQLTKTDVYYTDAHFVPLLVAAINRLIAH